MSLKSQNNQINIMHPLLFCT